MHHPRLLCILLSHKSHHPTGALPSQSRGFPPLEVRRQQRSHGRVCSISRHRGAPRSLLEPPTNPESFPPASPAQATCRRRSFKPNSDVGRDGSIAGVTEAPAAASVILSLLHPGHPPRILTRIALRPPAPRLGTRTLRYCGRAPSCSYKGARGQLKAIVGHVTRRLSDIPRSSASPAASESSGEEGDRRESWHRGATSGEWCGVLRFLSVFLTQTQVTPHRYPKALALVARLGGL
ncbi:hypothetical protein MRX96_013153 [Rhipicephalus microplus]